MDQHICSGNADMYGLGIRLGFYLQWLAGGLAALLQVKKDVEATRSGLFIFTIAVLIAVFVQIRRSDDTNPNSIKLDIYISLLLCFGFFYSLLAQWILNIFRLLRCCRLPKYTVVVASPEFDILHSLLLLAVSLLKIWFWSTKVVETPESNSRPPGCPEVGFLFPRLELKSGLMRGFNIFFDCCIIFCLVAELGMRTFLALNPQKKHTSRIGEILLEEPIQELGHGAQSSYIHLSSATGQAGLQQIQDGYQQVQTGWEHTLALVDNYNQLAHTLKKAQIGPLTVKQRFKDIDTQCRNIQTGLKSIPPAATAGLQPMEQDIQKVQKEMQAISAVLNSIDTLLNSTQGAAPPRGAPMGLQFIAQGLQGISDKLQAMQSGMKSIPAVAPAVAPATAPATLQNIEKALQDISNYCTSFKSTISSIQNLQPLRTDALQIIQLGSQKMQEGLDKVGQRDKFVYLLLEFAFRMIASIVVITATELTIRWNRLSDMTELGSAGQIIPFAIGLILLLHTIYRKFKPSSE